MVYEYFYSITKKDLVKSRANTCQSQDLSYHLFFETTDCLRFGLLLSLCVFC